MEFFVWLHLLLSLALLAAGAYEYSTSETCYVIVCIIFYYQIEKW